MKKSLTVILSSAMALSMLASVAMADTTTSTTTTPTSTTAPAAVKTSKDFTDLKGLDPALVAKIDVLLAKGYMEGKTDTTFDVTGNMTRAEAAKLVVKVLNLTVNPNATSSFSDVSATDGSISWAIPYIEAAKALGVIDGMTDATATAAATFAPKENVTIGQLATMFVKALGKKADVKQTAPWYQGYMDVAKANGVDLGIDGAKAATRTDLVVGSYAADVAIQASKLPAVVSVASVKATGVQTVTVNLDRDVDTTKATLSLKKGTVAINTTAKFADDKKSATLTLTDTKLSAGDYTVTLGGLDASAIKTATGTFTAQDEAVQKIEFVNTSDTIAQTTAAGKYANIKVKASNQYGENASASAGSYSVLSSGNGAVPNKISKDINGNLIIGLDTSGQTVGIGMVSITIINTDSHVSATKNFKVGTAPLLSKIELGAPVYSVGTGISGTGQNAKYALNLFDQYGNLIAFDQLGTAVTDIPLPQVIWNDYIDAANVNVVTENDGNNLPVLKISLVNNVDKTADYNFTVIDQAASTTGKLSISSTKIATKIQIGDLNDVIAAHDQNVYIPVIAYDAQGTQLSVDDLVSSANVGRITVAVAGATNANIVSGQGQIETTGEHKGTIHLTNISDNKNGAVSVNAFIATANASSTASKTYTIQAARMPDHFKEDTAPAKGAVEGGYSKFKYLVIDQYGKTLDTSWNVDSNGNYVSTGGNHYDVTVTTTTYTSDGTLTGTPLAFVASDATPSTPIVADATPKKYENTGSDFNNFNSTFRFVTLAGSAGKKVGFKAVLSKNGTEIARIDKSLTVALKTDDLTYSVNSVAILFNTIDSGVVTDSVYYDAGGTLQTLTADSQKAANTSMLAREVTLSGKNAAGDTVALPKTITAITSSNVNIAKVALGTGSNAGKAYVIGNKAGTAAINVSFTTTKGEAKQATVNITVKGDTFTVDKVVSGNSSKLSLPATLTALPLTANAWDAMDLQVTDNYGVLYEKQDAFKYNYLLAVGFSVTNVKNGSASVDQYGNITGTAGTTFDLVATSTNGKSAVTSIKLN